MIDDGILTVTGTLSAAAYALHVMSAPYSPGVFATRPGPLMAAADSGFVTVRGAGGHGSAPQRARDPIPAACEMVTALQTVVSRRLDPFSPAVLTVGQFHAGTKRTIIPETAEFELTVRTVDEHVREQIAVAVAEICENVARGHRVDASVGWQQDFDLTVKNGVQAAHAAAVAGELFGADLWVPKTCVTWADALRSAAGLVQCSALAGSALQAGDGMILGLWA